MLYWIVIQINLNSFNELFTEYQLCVVRPVARRRGYIRLSHPCSPDSIKNPVIMSSVCPLNLTSKLRARIVQSKGKKNKRKKESVDNNVTNYFLSTIQPCQILIFYYFCLGLF